MTPAPTAPRPSLLTTIVAESALEGDDRHATQDVVAELVHEHFGLSGQLTRLGTEKDDTFRLSTGQGELLVKLSPIGEDPAIIDLQTAVLAHLEAIAPELPVPRIVAGVDGRRTVTVGDDDDHQTAAGDAVRYSARVRRVLTFIEGLTLDRVEATAEQLGLVGAALGRLTAALRPLDHPRARRLLLWDLANFDQLRELSASTSSAHRRVASRIFDEFDRTVLPLLPSLRRQVVHNDFSPYNVVVDPDCDAFVTGMIDFGDVVHTAVVFDLAVALANQLGVDARAPWSRAGSIVAGYRRTATVTADELAILPTAAIARLALRALVSDWHASRASGRYEYLASHAMCDWERLEAALSVPRDAVRSLLADALAGDETKRARP